MVKICLIDDDQNILASLSLALKSEKFDVETYSDGISGLEALKKDDFDIAILDIKMPRLDGLEVDANGTVRANYTNGQNNPLGKLVLANFNNQNGLKQIGNATYVETAVSGTATVGEAGAEGFGTVLSGSLERSNVDITEELVNLITAQRNFQANAKSIETTAATTQAIVNIRM